MSHLVRLSVALAVLVPAFLAGWLNFAPVTFVVALVAFGGGELAARAAGRRAAAWVVLAAVVAGAAGSALAVTRARPAEDVVYAVEVDQLLETPSDDDGRVVRVHGTVAAGTLLRRAEPPGYRFVVKGAATELPVSGVGAVPDLLRDEVEVVVEGHLAGGELRATGVMVPPPPL